MYNSNKISAISFIACMMIVLIHVVDKPYKLGIAMLTQWAVPWFLIVSGYFFSKTLRDYNLVTIVRKKVNSLAIPYLLFGFGGGVMAAFPPENQPLWYVKHLVIFMAIWTCFDLIFKKCNNALIKSLLVASSYSAACCLLMKTTNQIIMPAAFIYFAIGVLLKHLGGLWRFAKIHSNAFLLISILLTIVAVALRVVYPEDPIVGVTAHNRLIRNFSNISSILFVWMAFEYLPTIVALENRMELPKYSFFVYLAHAPIIASGLVVTGQTEFFPLAILKVVILVAFLVGMGWLLRKVLPDFWNVIVGGRI